MQLFTCFNKPRFFPRRDIDDLCICSYINIASISTKRFQRFFILTGVSMQPRNNKQEELLNLLNRINTATQSSALYRPENLCPHCQSFRFDPMMDRIEAWAYTSFKPGTLAVWDCKKTYDLQPIKFGNAVRYRLSSLNRFVDERLKPE